MQIKNRIAAIEGRASAINLTLAEVCRHARPRQHLSTLQRWKTGECDPKLGTVDKVCGALERVLDAHEARIRKTLAVESLPLAS
jgi:predicted transcriptional regulator